MKSLTATASLHNTFCVLQNKSYFLNSSKLSERQQPVQPLFLKAECIF